MSDALDQTALKTNQTFKEKGYTSNTILFVFERNLFMQSFEQKIAKAKEILREYCVAEYRTDDVDFSDLSKIPIAYTTTEDDNHAIQVYVDLIDARILTTVDDELIETEEYQSLDEMISHVLPHLAFDNLVSIDEAALQSLEQKIKDATDKSCNDCGNAQNKQSLELERW